MKKLIVFYIILTSTLFLVGCEKNVIPYKLQETRVEDSLGLLQGNEKSIITCSLSLYSTIGTEIENGVSNNNKLEGEISKQKEPLILTFVDIDTDHPRMKGNLDEVELTKIEARDLIYFVESTMAGYLAIYTYFPKENLMILSKQYKLADTPYGMQMMGFCK